MENDYNPQNSTALSERKTSLKTRTKGHWPGSSRAATSRRCGGRGLPPQWAELRFIRGAGRSFGSGAES